MNCPINKDHKVILIEYDYTSPNHYDGVSEIRCLDCNKRFGRWTKKELINNEEETRFGE